MAAASSESHAISFGCEVRRTQDHALVQRAFNVMSTEACDYLWEHLQVESRYEPGELPDRHTLTGRQLLWHELLKASHQTAGTFFVVHELNGDECEPVFISADWTSAHSYARKRSAVLRPETAYPGLSVRSEAVVAGTVKKPPMMVAAHAD